MDWFLYDRDHGHERVNKIGEKGVLLSGSPDQHFKKELKEQMNLGRIN